MQAFVLSAPRNKPRNKRVCEAHQALVQAATEASDLAHSSVAFRRFQVDPSGNGNFGNRILEML